MRRDLVIGLLRGESIEAVSRDSHVSVQELDAWRTAFLDGATKAFGDQ